LFCVCLTEGDVLSGTSSSGAHHTGVLEGWFGEHWWNARAFVLLITTLFIFSPLACFKRIGKLSCTWSERVNVLAAFSLFFFRVYLLQLQRKKNDLAIFDAELRVTSTYFWHFEQILVIWSGLMAFFTSISLFPPLISERAIIYWKLSMYKELQEEHKL
jgi:hypothetical protein